MVVGEAVRRGVLGDVVQSERLRVVDQQSEHAVPAGQMADLGDQTGGHAVVDEGPQAAVGRPPRHAQRGVPGVHELAGDRHDALQHAVEADRSAAIVTDGVQQQPLLVSLATGLVSPRRGPRRAG